VSIWNNEWGYSLEDPELVRAEYVEKGVRMLDPPFPSLEGWAYYQLRDTVSSATNRGQLRCCFPISCLLELRGIQGRGWHE
jgi:hypothetical protein